MPEMQQKDCALKYAFFSIHESFYLPTILFFNYTGTSEIYTNLLQWPLYYNGDLIGRTNLTNASIV